MYQTTTGWLLHALYLGNTPVNSNLVHWNLSHMNYLCSVVCEFLSFACSPYHDIHIIICVLPHTIFVNVIGKMRAGVLESVWRGDWWLCVSCGFVGLGFGVWGLWVGWGACSKCLLGDWTHRSVHPALRHSYSGAIQANWYSRRIQASFKSSSQV